MVSPLNRKKEEPKSGDDLGAGQAVGRHPSGAGRAADASSARPGLLLVVAASNKKLLEATRNKGTVTSNKRHH